MELGNFVDYLKSHPDYQSTFVHHRYLPSRPAVYGPPIPMGEAMGKAIQTFGLKGLYSHQAEAIELVRKGNNVLAATPTASGKTLIFNLPILEEILRKPDTRALYLFPLKALEQDQMKGLTAWLNMLAGEAITAEIYDGDTPPYRRKKIRQNPPNILFTNPDMLHKGILAHHQSWEKFLKDLSFVVLDEIHTYRGIFGSHLNQIIRRLKRLCRFHGSSPRFILLSATVRNPKEFGSNLIGEEVKVVQETGSPGTGRHVVFLNPETSANFSSAKLFIDCVSRGFRTIVFTQSRKVTELIHLWVSKLSPELRTKISSYRAGFMPEERREIERKLATGNLLGVVSTSALEMGIDIGYLDICLLVGYPGTIINTWQRGGRVGRSGRESMIILVGKPDALDQYFMTHPDELFERGFEAAVLDPENPYVVRAHLPCAAAERPITLHDSQYWPEKLQQHLDHLERTGHLNRTAEGEPAWFPSRRNPHLTVNIRSAGEPYTIFEKETGQAIGTVDGIRAFKECHPGAIYLHRARQYVVDKLLLDKRDIVVQQSKLEYFTRTRSEKETEIIRIDRAKPEGQFVIRQGTLKVTELVTEYEKRALPGQGLLGVYPLELPPLIFETVGIWIEIEDAIKAFIERKELHFMGGIHAIEHAAIGIFPLFALCDRNDIGGICYPFHEQVGKSAIFIYDGYPGGVGLAQRGYEIISELLETTFRHVRDCGCENGCPSCIHSPKCGSGNKPLDKQAALLILKGLLGHIPLSEMVPDDQDTERNSPPEIPPDWAPHTSAGIHRMVFFDLETQKLAQDVGGWMNTHLMRVSVAVLFDTAENRFFTFFEDKVDDLISHLEKADLVVGFNVKRFDYRVLSAYTKKDLLKLPTFDILQDIHERLGFRVGLDHLAKETLNSNKSADGLKAVEWFRQGQMEKLEHYCSQDVALTRDLFNYGIKNGHLIYRKKGMDTRLRLLVDWNVDEMIRKI